MWFTHHAKKLIARTERLENECDARTHVFLIKFYSNCYLLLGGTNKIVQYIKRKFVGTKQMPATNKIPFNQCNALLLLNEHKFANGFRFDSIWMFQAFYCAKKLHALSKTIFSLSLSLSARYTNGLVRVLMTQTERWNSDALSEILIIL